jgi:hypothetical protein
MIAYETEHNGNLQKQIFKNKKDKTKNKNDDSDEDEDEKPQLHIPIILIISKVSSNNSGLLVTGIKKTNFIDFTSIGFTDDISTVYKKVKAGENILSNSDDFSYTTDYSRVKHVISF